MAQFNGARNVGESFEYAMDPEDTYMEVENESERKRTILTVVFSDNMLGACFYREDNLRLMIFPDCEESAPNFETLEMLITQIEPTLLLLNQSCNEAFKSKAKTLMSNFEIPSAEALHAGGSDGPSTSAATSSDFLRGNDSFLSCESRPNILLIANRFFSENFANNQILTLNVPRIASRTRLGRLLFVSSIINVTNTNLIRSIGALTKFLELDEEKTGERFRIDGLQNFIPERRVYVEKTTIEALQVFKSDWHPSNYKFGSIKDGFCVYSKFNRCVTRVGKAFMRKMFQHPLTDGEVLNERFDLISLFSAPENIEKVSLIKLNLKYVGPMHRIVKRMMLGHAPIKDWKILHRTLLSAITVFELIGAEPDMIENSSLLRRFVAEFNREVITNLSQQISATIDFAKSTKDDLFRVKRGCSEVIDSKMAVYTSLAAILDQEFLRDIPLLMDTVLDARMIYKAQLGFLIQVLLPEDATDCTLLGFELIIVSDGYAFYKSETCDRLDKDIGDIELDIRDQELSVMYSLQDVVLQCAQDIYDIVDKLAQIDCFIAIAEVSRESNYIRPTFNDSNEFRIVGGRHYLQEACTSKFVANDFVSGDGCDQSKVKIITGANACGKSIYMKQICLTSYMAQVGCFVPAESASLPLVDKMFTRIQTVESVSTKVSTFCFDLNQVSIATRNATSKSLVALDEFGKGTSISQGLSLLAATINYWIRCGHTPHLLVTTHLLSLPKLLRPSPKIEFNTFEVMTGEDAVVYAYKLKNGVTGSTFANCVARMVGVPQDVVNRAKEITEAMEGGFEISPLRNERYDNYVEKCVAVGRAFLQLNLRDASDPKQVIKDFLENVRRHHDR